ncbi:MAG TPA: squalene/phytoene synthase family protein [Solirubrobacteraceae bacterium]|nr:squalene/phytoene synthase family protein [Solirubrobacteraceae bacterium]
MSAPAIEIERCCRRCEEITREQAANFHYGIRLLPRDKRQAMCAVYAFARRVDDIGDDGSLDAEAQLAALARERVLVRSIDDPRSGQTPVEDPVRIALEWAVRRYSLPVDALEFLVEGVEYDVRGERYETFGDLVAYCRRVAGAVGRLCVAIFTDGNVTDEVDALADDLGIAMQLTNIIRDVREDREMGRIYLPTEDLERFGCALDAGLPPGGDAACAKLIRFEAARAAEWFDRGLVLTEHLDARSAACVRAMTGIYREVLDRIVADPDRVMRTRVSLAPWEKAWVAARSLAASTGVRAA